MIRSLRIENYKALRDVTLNLTPIHVLIGPNDTGKTSILEAIATLSRSTGETLNGAFPQRGQLTELVWQQDTGLPIIFEGALISNDSEYEYKYALSCNIYSMDQIARVHNESASASRDGISRGMSFERSGKTKSYVSVCPKDGARGTGNAEELARLVYDLLNGVQTYRWNPHHLSLPVAAEAGYTFPMGTTGFGLARCLDDILGQSREAFSAIESRFISVFQDVKALQLAPGSGYLPWPDQPNPFPAPEKGPGRALFVQFKNGPRISAAQVSDGMLFVLAYLCLLYLPKPPRIILVEEPENGVHPARLKEVLGILRQLVQEQSRTQVIMTTHSPYVLDMFDPKQVTLCTKQADGSIAVKRLSESKKVAEQLDVFTLGEIWTAEGDEALAAPDPVEEPGQ